MLAFGSVVPGVALAGEADSEGEGTSPAVELPIPPDFDPGGEETGLGEVPAAGGDEESGVVETEPEVDAEAPAAGEVTSAATEAPVEAQPPTSVTVPEPATSAPEPEPIQQQAPEPATSEPVANQSIVAPQQEPAEQRADSSASTGEAAPPSEAPSAPPLQPAATPPVDHGRHLGGRDSYVVRSGDCLWHVAAALLPAGARDAEIADEVARLWTLNENRIGTGDPSLIYAGTTLRLR